MLKKDDIRDPQNLVYIQQLLRKQGFCCDAYKPSYLKRRIMVRLRANQIESYREYFRFLKKDPEEYKKLLDALTINVTGFFRDSDVYGTIREKIIPEILESSQEKRNIRIWSAGCASGEEPYSIAMLMIEVLGAEMAEKLVSIFATDIDERSLEGAKAGKYTTDKMENLQNDLIQKYFNFDQQWYVVNELKKFVKFKRLDLLSDKGIKLCDVVFCRNVMIYLNREDQQKVLNVFYESLRPGGYLILGKTEVLAFGFSDKFKCVDTRAHIYKKISALKG